jgi:hypothetical protein
MEIEKRREDHLAAISVNSSGGQTCQPIKKPPGERALPVGPELLSPALSGINAAAVTNTLGTAWIEFVARRMGKYRRRQRPHRGGANEACPSSSGSDPKLSP